MTEFIYVTGCDTGFGRILTGKLDKLGYGVFPGCFMPDTLTELKKECSDRVVPIRLDVSKEESVLACAATIKEELAKRPGAKLVGVVNNAGILVTPGPVEFTPIDSFKRMLDVNFLGTVMVTKSVLPLIRASQGRVVNVASIAGRLGIPSQPAYCPSKYCVEAFSDILRTDMIPFGVTVHIIEPGVFNKTGLYGNYQTGLDELWGKLSDDIKQDYGTEFYQGFRKQLGTALTDFGNSNSDLVPEAMVHALTSEKPKYRYRVGVDSKYLVTFLSWLPEGLQDLVLTFRDSRAPEVLPSSAPANGKAICNARYKGPNYKLYFFILALIFIYRRASR